MAALPWFTRQRPGALARGVALLLCLLALPSPARAEEPALPEGILRNRGIPPLLPYSLRDQEAISELLPHLVAHGRTHAGTRRGGDALFSAAWCYATYVRRPREASALYAEARSAYPPHEPLRGIVLVRHAALEAARDNWPAARRLLEAALTWRERTRPVDLEGEEAHRHDQLAQVLAREFPLLVARVFESEGSLTEAAGVLKRMLDREGDALPPSEQARLWQQIAQWRLRAGKTRAALEAIDASIERTDDEAKQVDRRFWRLHAKHGLIAKDGAAFLPSTWPGDGYEADMRGFLRGIEGIPGSGTVYLALGSTAFAAGRKEIALEIYLVALRAPDLMEAARQDASIWRGLLMGYAAALEAGRLEEAERILDAVARIADEPIEELDALRIALADAREAQEGTPPGPRASEGEGAPAESSPEQDPRLLPAGIRPQVPASGGEEPDGPDALEDATRLPLRLILLLLGLFLGLLALWRWRRGRGGPR